MVAASHDWKKVKDLFHEALRRHPADRDAFLNNVCRDDLNLRIEVESLLLSLDEAKTFLEEPAVPFPSLSEVQWQFSNGDLVSHYRILDHIGVGGMAQVYLAEDENLYRQVALKVLPRELLEDVDRLRRFKREALAVSALNHPNILTIFEFLDADGMPIIASEFVKGCTLRDRLRKGRLELNVAADIAIQVAAALLTAHEAGVIHRDIKPENVMIRDDGYVKVLDFGLAKLTGNLRSKESDRSHTQAFSSPGLIMGTATYMSPEQARSMPIDARTDIFSLGIVLYEMVAGHVPFTGSTTTDIIAEIIQADPPEPSVYNSAVPESIDRIIKRCLQKRREDRYGSVSELLVDLRSIAKSTIKPEPSQNSLIDSQPTQVLPADAVERALEDRNIAEPERPNLVTLAAVLLLIIGIAALSYYLIRSLL